MARSVDYTPEELERQKGESHTAPKDYDEYLRICRESNKFPLRDTKQPYKCPCCDGWGKRVGIQDDLHQRIDATLERGASQKVDCPACKGRGLVWG